MMKIAMALMLVSIAIDPSWATPPAVLSATAMAERGEFNKVNIVSGDTAFAGTYLTGIGLQNMFQGYAVKLDETLEHQWTRTWGNTIRMLDCVWHDSVGTMVGYTTENATHDYEALRFTGGGSLEDNWQFGGNTTVDHAYAVAYYRNGMYLLAGDVSPGAQGSSDGSLVLVTEQGEVEWSQTYDSSAIVRRIAVADSATIWLFGTTDSTAGQGRDFWMARVDSTGQLQQSFRYGGLRAEELFDAQRVSAGLTVLVGSTRSYGDSTQTDVFFVATNDAGELLFAQAYGGSENDAALCVSAVADRDSGFVIGGYWSEEHLATRNGFLMKFDQYFDSLWTIVRHDTLNASEFRDVAVDAEYRYLAAGVTAVTIPHGFYLLTDVDPAAPIQHPPLSFGLLAPADDAFFVTDTMRFTWQATSDPDPGDQVAYALLFDSDTLFDDPLAVGPLPDATHLLTRADDIFDRYWRVVAQDQHGNLRTCEDGYRHVRKIRPDSTLPFNLLSPADGSALTTPIGEFLWEEALDPDSLDESVFYCLYFQVGDSISPIDTIYGTVANVSFADHPFIGESDTVQWWVVADSDYPQMQRHSTQTWTFINWNVSAPAPMPLPAEFALDRAYPNPFNSSVSLEYSLPRAAHVELTVYDLHGRMVATLVSATQAAGTHSARWDGSANGLHVGSGIYFARLKSENFLVTQKLLLIK